MTVGCDAYRAKDGDVYHDDPDCYSGRRIPEADRVYDRGSLPRCPECAARARVRGRPSGA
jgi:hypothetical protein